MARLGLPLALQWGLIAVSTTALQRVVNDFGPTAVAVFTATNRLEQLVQQPFGSMSMALSTYAGQNIGAGRRGRIVRIRKIPGAEVIRPGLFVQPDQHLSRVRALLSTMR